MDKADNMVLVMMLEPEMAFSSTFMSPVFLMLRGMCGDSLWISSRDTFGQISRTLEPSPVRIYLDHLVSILGVLEHTCAGSDGFISKMRSDEA